MRRKTPSLVRLFTALLFAVLLLGSATSSAQSLGDLARQQRERARNKVARSPHVFTNEDLARPKILEASPVQPLPAEASAAPAPSTLAPAPSTAASATGPAVPSMAPPVWPEGTPLGDIARYYRQQKQLRVPNLEPPALAQAKNPDPKTEPPSRTPVAPRNTASRISRQQPLQKPKKIIAVAEPAVFENIPAPRVVRVSPGDSLWKIATRHLGDGNQWRVIASANPEITNPDVIHAGQQIRLPGESATTAAAANQVRVQAGDSLWKLAKAHWGNGQAWSCIAESNPEIQDSSRIYPGQTLTLPASCSPTI
ncbi:MAG: LysM peptidoglycan-binding domain-containing protein [Acidobacteria bacterium]|nr:LysM peptidoglycan-binding domain-containing protein [Acidobacteriota bacterium]